MRNSPPKWPYTILRRILSRDHLDILYGDILEMYEEQVEEKGWWFARIHFFMNVLSLLRVYFLKTPSNPFNSITLLGSYYKMAFRSLISHPTHSLINFVGLGTGFFVSIMIAQYVFFQKNFDQFHQNADQIYRVSYLREVNDEASFYGATTFLPVGPQLVAGYPEIENQCRLYYAFTHGIINVNNEPYLEEKPVFADPSYFELFSYELLRGNPTSVLAQPNSVILSSSLAHRYFGDNDPIGKSLEFSFEDGSAVLEVTGIMEDPRDDSHIRLNMLISFSTLDQWPIFDENKWTLPFYHTYVLVKGDSDIKRLESSASRMLSQNRSLKEGTSEIHIFQPLTRIHLHSNLSFELGTNGNDLAINLLIVVATFILVLAYLNYINLTTSMAINRAKEIGIRKVMGSSRLSIIFQFLLESTLLNLISAIIAVLIVALTVGQFSNLIGIHIEFATSWKLWLPLTAIVVLGAILSGFYPALVLSSYQPRIIFDSVKKQKGAALRKFLVTSQYIISMCLIGGFILIYSQTHFLLERDPGFDSDKIMVITAPKAHSQEMNYLNSMRNFGKDLMSIPEVNGFTHSGSVPGKVMGSVNLKVNGIADAPEIAVSVNTVDHGYFETYGLNFLAGRPFSKEFSDQMKIVINKEAMNALGFSNELDAIKSELSIGSAQMEVLGVVENYHHTSLKAFHEPIVFFLNPQNTIYVSLNLNTENLPNTLDKIEATLRNRFPGNPFNYFFLDDSFQSQFTAELQYIKLFRIFSILAIVLAILGIFGMSSFLIKQRTKEIGIRKILGANAKNIFLLLTSSFFLPVALGIVLGSGLLIVVGEEWLNTFPYRTEFTYAMFLIPSLILFLITLITLAVQMRSVDQVDVIKTLQDE